MLGPECRSLADRFRQKQEEGLVDIKFYLRNKSEAASEQICREVNSLYAAIDRGEWAPLDFKKRRR